MSFSPLEVVIQKTKSQLDDAIKEHETMRVLVFTVNWKSSLLHVIKFYNCDVME